MKTKVHFFIISRSVVLIVRNISEKICREIQNTHFVSQYLFFENRAVYEIIWKKIIYNWTGHKARRRLRI